MRKLFANQAICILLRKGCGNGWKGCSLQTQEKNEQACFYSSSSFEILATATCQRSAVSLQWYLWSLFVDIAHRKSLRVAIGTDAPRLPHGSSEGTCRDPRESSSTA